MIISSKQAVGQLGRAFRPLVRARDCSAMDCMILHDRAILLLDRSFMMTLSNQAIDRLSKPT